MEFPTDPNVIVGLDAIDDAGVYKINDELAIVQTVDFFTPIVDDPYWFGQIAAANALSDIYAMGGIPKTALNLVAFPVESMDISVLREIIQGGIDKMKEAAVVLIGGHSVEDDELKFGYSVTGFAHPGMILLKNDLRAGDKLLLTKPLGTGIINTAIKGGIASPDTAESVTRLMAELNRDAAMVMKDYPVHACTDITGFGLLGHLAEMVEGSGLSVSLQSDKIPVIPQALEFAGIGMVPAGAYKNKAYREKMVAMSSSIDPLFESILFDPQTSGGLLICIAGARADELLDNLRKSGIREAEIIGEVRPEPGEKIFVN